MKAYKLITKANGDSSFLVGSIPKVRHIKTNYFFVQDHIADWENGPHCAPRHQFVVTIKGKLKFTVTSGDSFIIEPGVILIADDLKGKGHVWEMVDCDEWHRVYIVPEGDDCFVEDSVSQNNS